MSTHGFTLLEVVIALALISIVSVLLFSSHSSSWRNVIGSDKLLIAGHLIEQRIEHMRTVIDRSPDDFFPPESSQLSENGIHLTWTISEATRPTDGATITNVRKCSFVASWGKGKNDTLKVSTYLSKMF